MSGVITTAATVCCLTVLTVLAAAVHVPYALAALNGCV